MRSFLALVVVILASGNVDAGFGKHGRRSGGSCGSGACASGSCGMASASACATGACVGGVCNLPPPAPQPPALVPVPGEPKSNVKVKETKHGVKVKAKGHAALDQLNSQRAQRGLRPYVLDEGLQAAAEQCAQIRAAQHIHGHLPTGNQFPLSDFSLLDGVTCACTGAGANTPDWGFTACEAYGNYTFAGASGVMGSDGRYYCSLYLR